MMDEKKIECFFERSVRREKDDLLIQFKF